MERKAKDYSTRPPKLRKYKPSSTECLLEEMCQSFGTELGQAYVNPLNGTKLVRESRPVIIQRQQTGERRLLQFQYTKFTPFQDGRWFEVWEKNVKHMHPKRKREYTHEEAWEQIKAELEANGKVFDPFLEVTVNDHIPNIKVARFEKELYFAVFDVPNREISEKELKPFLIHDLRSPMYQWQHERNPPIVWIKYHRQPCFFVHRAREHPKNEYDFLVIDFPKVHGIHSSAIGRALTSYPLDKLRVDGTENLIFKIEYTNSLSFPVHHNIPPEQIMGFVQQYLKEMCLARTL